MGTEISPEEEKCAHCGGELPLDKIFEVADKNGKYDTVCEKCHDRYWDDDNGKLLH